MFEVCMYRVVLCSNTPLSVYSPVEVTIELGARLAIRTERRQDDPDMGRSESNPKLKRTAAIGCYIHKYTLDSASSADGGSWHTMHFYTRTETSRDVWTNGRVSSERGKLALTLSFDDHSGADFEVFQARDSMEYVIAVNYEIHTRLARRLVSYQPYLLALLSPVISIQVRYDYLVISESSLASASHGKVDHVAVQSVMGLSSEACNTASCRTCPTSP